MTNDLNQFPVALPKDINDPNFIPALNRILLEVYNYVDYKNILDNGVTSDKILSLVTSKLSGIIPQTNLNIADLGWVQTCAFSVTDADTVAWGAGVFTSANGVTYNISAGNTGNMAAKTYIYLDIAVSTTAYQTTTTQANVIGAGKVLIGVATNGSSSATYKLTETTQIVADNMIVNTLSAISGNLGTITAGTVTGATIRTAASGARVNIDSTGLTFYNAGGTAVLTMATATGEITIGGTASGFYTLISPQDATPIKIYSGGTYRGYLQYSDHGGNYCVTLGGYNQGSVALETSGNGRIYLGGGLSIELESSANVAGDLDVTGILSTHDFTMDGEASSIVLNESGSVSNRIYFGTNANRASIYSDATTGGYLYLYTHGSHVTTDGYLSILGASIDLGSANNEATDKRVINLRGGGFADPGANNTDSNGDKIILFNSSTGNTGDMRIGVGDAANLWFKTWSTGQIDMYFGSTLKFYFDDDGNGYADTGWTTYSPDIKKDIKKDVISHKDYLGWALVDAKKPIKPYKGIRRTQEEKETYGKDISKIAIGTAIWAEKADEIIDLLVAQNKDLNTRITSLENKLK